MSKIIFILPEFKDGGGNRWSVDLSNYLCKNFKVELFALKKSKNKTIHNLNTKVKKNFFEFNINNIFTRIYLYLNIFLKLRKKEYKNDLVIITDPIISIFSILLYPRKIIRNIAADDYNLYNGYKLFKYLGILHIYKLLLNISFIYPKTNYFFITKYVFIKCPSFFKKKFFLNNNVEANIIPPSVEEIYFEKERNRKINKIETICLFPRKQNFKGLKIFDNENFQEELSKLGIKKIILVSNEKLSFNILKKIKVEIVKPRNDLDIIDNLDKSDLFISTSKNEGFSLPPIEAMARKVPVIMANGGGNLTYGINGHNCLIYENNEIIEITNKIKIIIKDQKLRNKIIENGLQTAHNYKSSFLNKVWEKRIKKILSNQSQSDDKIKNFNLSRQLLGYFKKNILIIKSLDRELFFNILFELAFFPILIINNFIKLHFSFAKKQHKQLSRTSKEYEIKLCFQDWCNYPNNRYKLLKNLFWYRCGITNYKELFKTKKYIIKKYIYLSGSNSKKIDDLELSNEFETVLCENDYFDFGSYSKFYNVNNKLNNILIFCNSSISNEKVEIFLDDYLDYFIQNKDIGLLGISGNSKNYQSLLFNNFTPHLQSIFFITSSEVLRNVIKSNKNIFPGLNATKYNKYSIIKKGEIILSKIVLDLGYKIAIVKSDGEIFKFKKDNIPKMYSDWKNNYKLGDARLQSIRPSYPYKITI